MSRSRVDTQAAVQEFYYDPYRGEPDMFFNTVRVGTSWVEVFEVPPGYVYELPGGLDLANHSFGFCSPRVRVYDSSNSHYFTYLAEFVQGFAGTRHPLGIVRSNGNLSEGVDVLYFEAGDKLEVISDQAASVFYWASVWKYPQG